MNQQELLEHRLDRYLIRLNSISFNEKGVVFMKGITERQLIEIENMTAVRAILGCVDCLTIGILVYESISAHKEKQEEGS